MLKSLDTEQMFVYYIISTNDRLIFLGLARSMLWQEKAAAPVNDIEK